MSNDFKLFVQRYPDIFNKQNIGEKLLQLDWEQAPLFLSEIFNDDQEIIDYHLFHQNYSTLLEYLPKVKDLALVVNALLRIPGSQIAMSYISNNNIIDPAEIMLLLSNLPQISNKVIGFPKSRIQEILLVLSHCLNKDIVSLNNIIQSRTCSLEILSSFCIYFKLFEPAAKALVKMGMPIRSIAVAYKGGISLAFSILNIVKASEKKQCWMKLLSIAEDNDRKTIIKKIISSDLFEFEELLQFVDDNEQIGLYRDKIKESAQKLQFTEGECLFQRKFKPPQMQDFVLKLSDCCDVCSSKLITTEFIRFPCGHSFHEDCLKNLCQREGIPDDDIFESCPLCGFSSLIDQFSSIY
ncbi:hypothetical protein TVAG_356850 [Trichomonas vaginalis G3]|uniref:RING-type domain-containing protein n=1 Tax=Trichomonas vaginalis (strain ATCC PRA-98 / G3) TaxID=412133 RepID=A2FZU8_TRIV3|nr:notochord cell vacuolation [Trichomonas vaginalis G3]EAX89570.1 hypothetical protein TVAG_356850 [Trichomonas vaginalis G3]KAI5507556.1 notochord cell vacuolation [Trichomonas vaginalis G3]|eukprot:XP_001302500.1 hypothetical protein [Trichomonas vaginalis G3]